MENEIGLTRALQHHPMGLSSACALGQDGLPVTGRDLETGERLGLVETCEIPTDQVTRILDLPKYPCPHGKRLRLIYLKGRETEVLHQLVHSPNGNNSQACVGQEQLLGLLRGCRSPVCCCFSQAH